MSLFEQVAKVRKGVALSMATRDGLCSHLPRAAAAAGVPAGARQRQRRAVRQLPAHPLLGAAAGPDPAARHDRVVTQRSPSVRGEPASGGLSSAALPHIIRARVQAPRRSSPSRWTAALGLAAGRRADTGGCSTQQNDASSRRTAPCATTTAPTTAGCRSKGSTRAVAAPSLAAMMLSKITSGTALATVHAAGTRPGGRRRARQGHEERRRSTPPASASRTRPPWTAWWRRSRRSRPALEVERRRRERSIGPTGARLVTASIVRELPSPAAAGRRGSKRRCTGWCSRATPPRERARCSWPGRPIPKRGTLSVASTASRQRRSRWRARERMGNGDDGDDRTGGVRDRAVRRKRLAHRACRSARSRPGELFAGETVTFPFDELRRTRAAALGLLPLTCFQHASAAVWLQTRPRRIAATSRPACSFSARYDVSTSRCIAVQSPDSASAPRARRPASADRGWRRRTSSRSGLRAREPRGGGVE